MKTRKGVLSNHDVAWMKSLGAAMQRALSSDEGLIALAQEMVPEITRELEEKFWVPLVLREDPLPVGKVPKYRVKEELDVHWMAPGGEPAQQRVRKGQEIQFPLETIEAFIVVKARDLKMGYVSDLTSQQAEAGRKIRNQINASAAGVMSAAAESANDDGVENIFEITSGGKLTLDGVKGAIAYFEDQEMSVKQMVMRGSRLVDMYDWSLPEEVQAELIKAGVLKKFGTASWGWRASFTDDFFQLPNRGNHILHPPLLAPHLRSLALALHVVRVKPAGVFDLDDRLAPVFVFHKEIWQIAPLMLLTVYPGNGDPVPLHPFDHMRIALKAVHHAPLQVALVLLEVPRAFLRSGVFAMYANCHVRSLLLSIRG